MPAKFITYYGSAPRRAQPWRLPDVDLGRQPPRAEPVVYFDRGSSKIEPIYRYQLRLVAPRISNSASQRKVLIEGHANPHDTEDGAVELSRRRAEAVAAMLKVYGVPARRIEVIPRGSRLRAAERAAKRVAAWNRRVQVIVPPAPAVAAIKRAPEFDGPARVFPQVATRLSATC